MSDRKPNTTCPLCEAAPGFPCLTWNGREREPHADRPSVPTPPVPEGLDFEKAATEARKGMTDRIEDAAKAMMALDLYKPENADVVWAAFEPDEREHHLRRARAAEGPLTADLSAEVQRLRGELTEARKRTKEAEGDMVMQTVRRDQAESNLASLRASHQEVTRIVREWQEARKAFDEVAGAYPPDYAAISEAYKRVQAAEAALAALDLGGAE